MPGTRSMPYIPIDPPVELPNDLPIPSTSRVLRPRSRATSLARSEMRDASGSRTVSRASSSHSAILPTFGSRLVDLRFFGDDNDYLMTPPSSQFEPAAGLSSVDAVINTDGGIDFESTASSSTPSMPTEGAGSFLLQDPNTEQPSNPNLSVPAYIRSTDETYSMAGHDVENSSSTSGSSSRGKRKRESSEIHMNDDVNGDSWTHPDSISEWQMDGSNFRAPLRLGLDGRTPSSLRSGSGASSSKRKRSPPLFGSAGEPISQPLSYADLDTQIEVPGSGGSGNLILRHADMDAEDEVADQLLLDDASHLAFVSSSQEQARKRKGKARAKTPDPESVILISDSPPTPYKEVKIPEQKTSSKPDAEPLSSYTCPICFSPPTNATLTPCGHISCGACLFAAVRTTMQRTAAAGFGSAQNEAKCPVCRATIPGWDGKGAGVIGLQARAIFRL